MRYDLAFFLCCCKSFLGDTEGEDFYSLLSLERDATQEEIKRAYKRQSLQMHPDKLAQRGKQVTEEDQARFTRMKEAYEVLSDPHKRETYDAIGERGMKWLEEPFSLDPQELAHNFATSSTLDRSKIFAIFVSIAVGIFILPIMVCLQADQIFGPDTSWALVLLPLWIWNAIILFYHSRVIMMGPIQRPEHIPPEEWVDPLPMAKRIFSLVRFLALLVFEILAALKLDEVVSWPWAVVFLPIYLWEASTFYKKWPLARMKIVTVQDLETALGKPFAEFTPAEKELIVNRYSVVPSLNSPEFEAAHKLKMAARQDLVRLVFRVALLIFLIMQLDKDLGINWWLVFTPFWIMTLCICYSNYQSFAEVQAMAAAKDPTLFGVKASDEENPPTADGGGASGSNYGAMGADGETPSPANAKPEISEDEKEELKAQVMSSGSKMVGKCCSQAFLLLIVCLFVGKIQGAPYSALWIISPLLFVAGIALCCLGCTIFCITEIPNEADFDSHASPSADGGAYVPPGSIPTGDEANKEGVPSPSKSPGPTSQWDPEKGQVWDTPEEEQAPSNNAATGAGVPGQSTTPIPPSSEEQTQGASAAAAAPVVDLLDDNSRPASQADSEIRAGAVSCTPTETSTIHELD